MSPTLRRLFSSEERNGGLLFAVDKPTRVLSSEMVDYVKRVLHIHHQTLIQASGNVQLEMPPVPSTENAALTSDDHRDAPNTGKKRPRPWQRRNRKDQPAFKVGHGGTLDPLVFPDFGGYLASGVLVIAVGRQTKNLNYFLTGNHCRKTYEVTAQLGTETDTYDSDGQVTGTAPVEHVTEPLLRDMLAKEFTGAIQQQPPAFSALRVNGKRMHELARKAQASGEAMPVVQPRSVHIFEAQFLHWDPQTHQFRLRVTCGGGTYIRSIVHDLAKRVGSCAHMTALRRLAQGPFTVGESMSGDTMVPVLSLVDLQQSTKLSEYLQHQEWQARVESYLEQARNGQEQVPTTLSSASSTMPDNATKRVKVEQQQQQEEEQGDTEKVQLEEEKQTKGN